MSSEKEHLDAGFPESGEKELSTTGVYKRRWLMLAMFVSLSMSNAFQWMEYAIIPNIIEDFYGVDNEAVNWTSMIYMVMYIPFVFPAAWILDKYGLRVVALLGAFGNTVGAWIKCASANPNLFPVTFLGQTIVGTSQIFILGLPTRLAAVWFGPNEVSTACAMGVFGNQLGIAFGFLIPPIMVPSNATAVDTGAGLRHLFFTSAGVNSMIFLTILLFFKDRPPTAPSPAQLAAIESTVDHNFFQSLKKLALNFNFILLIVTYGMNVGVFYAVSTLLGRMLSEIYVGKNEEIGQIGLLIVLAGMLGSVIAGIWLDRTKTFKLTTFIVYLFSFGGMLVYTFTIDQGKLWLVFVVAALLGFFMTGYLPIGFEFGLELTYPISEGTVSGMLNVSCQVFGMLETLILSKMMDHFNTLASNLACCAILFVGSGLTLLIKADLRRQNASKIEASRSDEKSGGSMPLGKEDMVMTMPHTQSKIPILMDNDDREGTDPGFSEDSVDNSVVDGHMILADNVRLTLDLSHKEEIL